jgi:Bacterial archaeo-eukaryotic release factor family 11
MLHLDIPSRTDIEYLIGSRGPGRVSIYLPTTPLTQDAQADRIVLKNLATRAVEQLAQIDKRKARLIEDLLFDLVDDDDFWATQANSLAVFATSERVQTFRLPNRLQEAVEVSNQFLIKPLLRSATVPQHAFVLALSQNEARLVEVSADLPAFRVKVHGMPQDAASAVGKASIKGRTPSGRIQGSEGQKVRLAQYARQVDQALRDVLSGRETPLVLAAIEPLASIFRSITTYPHLAKEGIPASAEVMSDAELAELARNVLDGLFRNELEAIRAMFAQREGQGRTTTDVVQAARAATNGAIAKLLVDIDLGLPGTVDDEGAVTFADAPGPRSHDVLDEITSRAFRTGARVLSVRREDIPGHTGVAAILRYPA